MRPPWNRQHPRHREVSLPADKVPMLERWSVHRWVGLAAETREFRNSYREENQKSKRKLRCQENAWCLHAWQSWKKADSIHAFQILVRDLRLKILRIYFAPRESLSKSKKVEARQVREGNSRVEKAEREVFFWVSWPQGDDGIASRLVKKACLIRCRSRARSIAIK